MLVLVDTNVLLRLMEPGDPQHAMIRRALRRIIWRGDRCVTSPQNAAEFWNDCTRPLAARGGFGLTATETDRRLRIIERLFPVLADGPAIYAHWRNLVASLGIIGIAAHDTRLVAFMVVYGMTEILTTNVADFIRFPGIKAVTPADVLSASP